MPPATSAACPGASRRVAFLLPGSSEMTTESVIRWASWLCCLALGHFLPFYERTRESTASESGARGAGRKRPSGLKGWLARAADAACGRPCGHHPADIAPAQPVPLAPRHVPLPGAPMQREERGGGDSRLHLRQLSRFLPTSRELGEASAGRRPPLCPALCSCLPRHRGRSLGRSLTTVVHTDLHLQAHLPGAGAVGGVCSLL